jgi:hypothetical protein
MSDTILTAFTSIGQLRHSRVHHKTDRVAAEGYTDAKVAERTLA